MGVGAGVGRALRGQGPWSRRQIYQYLQWTINQTQQRVQTAQHRTAGRGPDAVDTLDTNTNMQY